MIRKLHLSALPIIIAYPIAILEDVTCQPQKPENTTSIQVTFTTSHGNFG